jgi:hypothetical protein
MFKGREEATATTRSAGEWAVDETTSAGQSISRLTAFTCVHKLHIAKYGDARTIVFLFQLFQAPWMSGVPSPLHNNLREKTPIVRFTRPFIGYPNDPRAQERTSDDIGK